MADIDFGTGPGTGDTVRAALEKLQARIDALQNGGGNQPNPAPVFVVQPSITPTSGAAGTTFTANDGQASNATSYSRRWLLDGTSIGTGTTVVPVVAGSLVLEVTAENLAGMVTANSQAVTVTASGGGTPTPTPGPVFANLAQVSSSQFATNANETWWAEQTTINPARTYAVKGFTDNTGLQFWAEFNLASSTKVPTDTRRVEFPAFFSADEHNEQPCYFASNGALWLAVTGHSNANNNTAAGQARILFFYSATGRLADIQEAQTFSLSGSTSTAGTNYGYWIERPDGTMLFFTNQDSNASWRFIGFPSGDYKQPIEYRSVSAGRPNGGGGQNQAYYLPSRIDSNTLELNFQPHPSNARNIVQSFDINLTTGEMTGGGQSFGNAFTPYTSSTPLVNFANTSGTTTLGTVKPNADPGDGRSIRIMDAVGRGFGGAVFDASNGANPSHFWSEGNTFVSLGNPGTALDTPRRYFRGLKRAREPIANGAYRWYRCFTDGTNNTLERIDAPTLSGTQTATTMYTSTTNKVTRPFVFDRATDAMAVVVAIGPRYTSYTSYDLGMIAFASTDTASANPQPTPAPANSVAPAISGSPVVGQTLTVSNGTWSGSPTYAYQWKRSGTPISGATTTTYTLVSADVGATITCAVTATNAGGSTTAESSPTGTVTAAGSSPNTVIIDAPFTNTTGSDIDLASYASTVGGGWTNISASGVAFVSALNNRVRKGPAASNGHTAYRSNTVPTSPNYDIEVDVLLPSSTTALGMMRTGNTVSDLMGFGYSSSSGWVIGYRTGGGSFVNLVNMAFTAPAGSSYKWKLQVRGDVLTFLVDSGSGYQQVATTTTTRNYGSSVGIDYANNSFNGSDTAGPQFDNFKVTDNIT